MLIRLLLNILLASLALASGDTAVFERGSADLTALFARDACSAAFGSNASNAICSPSNTLCCVRKNQDFPQCDAYLSKGWCCVGSDPTDNCYVDQPSECNVQNSVPCTNLAAGTAQACCPSLTSCDPTTNASLANVRCNIKRSDLIAADSASATTSSPSSSSSSSATSGTSTSTSTASIPSLTTGSSDIPSATTTPIAAPPPQPDLSPGAIAGIAIGVVAVLVAATAVFYLFWRERRKLRVRGAEALASATKYIHGGQYRSSDEYNHNVTTHPVEIMGSIEHGPVELDAMQHHPRGNNI